MPQAMTKTKITAAVAEAAGISKKQAAAAMDALVQLAYKNAKNGFPIAGLGKLVLVQRKARTGINPQTKEPIKIPAKKVLKFRIAKQAKDAILPPKK